MNTKITCLVIISYVGFTASLFGQSGGGQDASERLAKLNTRLKQLDANNNGMIDADEATTGVGKVLIDRYYPNGAPQFPLAITEIMRVAEVQIRGGTASGAAPSSGSAPAAAQPQSGSSPSPAAPSGSPASQQPTSGATTPAGSTASAAAPQTGATIASPGAHSSSPPSVGTASSSTVSSRQSRPLHKSGRISTAKERLQSKGLPDWFLKKMDSTGQITMAEYSDTWTAETVAAFEKYDLNHDGIITADEVLKVEGHHSGK